MDGGKEPQASTKRAGGDVVVTEDNSGLLLRKTIVGGKVKPWKGVGKR